MVKYAEVIKEKMSLSIIFRITSNVATEYKIVAT